MAERAGLQDYTQLADCLPSRTWDSLLDAERSFAEKADVLLHVSWSLGLRNPSEPTFGAMTALCCLKKQQSAFEAQSRNVQMKDLWRSYARRLKGFAQAGKPEERIDRLRSWSQLPAAVRESVGEPIPCPVPHAELQAVYASIPQRKTRGQFVERVRGPCVEAGQIAGQLLQSMVEAMRGGSGGQEPDIGLRLTRPGAAAAAGAHMRGAEPSGPQRPHPQPLALEDAKPEQAKEPGTEPQTGAAGGGPAETASGSKAADQRGAGGAEEHVEAAELGAGAGRRSEFATLRAGLEESMTSDTGVMRRPSAAGKPKARAKKTGSAWKKPAAAPKKTATTRKPAAQGTEQEDTCKRYASRAYHLARREAEKRGRTPDQVKAAARKAHRAAVATWQGQRQP